MSFRDVIKGTTTEVQLFLLKQELHNGGARSAPAANIFFLQWEKVISHWENRSTKLQRKQKRARLRYKEYDDRCKVTSWRLHFCVDTYTFICISSCAKITSRGVYTTDRDQDDKRDEWHGMTIPEVKRFQRCRLYRDRTEIHETHQTWSLILWSSDTTISIP